MRILVVDDNAENRYLLEVVFRAHGHEVVSAANGLEALEKLEQEDHIELIVSDILMPKMDGYRLCRACRQQASLKNIPFVFITAAYTDEKDERFALTLGADRFVRRPIEPDALMAIIDGVIAEYRTAGARPPAVPAKEETRYLAEYGERVQSQLEQKVRELESEIAKRQRVERALRTLSACNEALVRATDESQLLQEMCRLIVEVGGFRLAWVGFAEHDAAKSVRPVAQCGDESGYLQTAGITWADTERGRGPTGTAIRTGAPQVNQDVAHDERMAPWRAEALERGYASSVALPLANAAGVFGALMIYAQEPDAFNADEVALLTELASDLAYGVIALRTRAERDRAVAERAEYLDKIRRNFEETIEALAALVETRDPYTAGHEKRVAALATAVGKELGLPDDQIDGLHVAGSIIDVGKVGVPTEILTRPGALVDVEFDLVKVHAQAGYDILRAIDFPWPVATMVLQHHERLDGSGYPQGLKGDEILLGAKILAIADVVESMASHRPHRAALGVDAALDEITAHRGTLYDPPAVDACVRLFKEKAFTFPGWA